MLRLTGGRYEKLFNHKDEIEKNFGEPLNWDFNESRKQQYIRSSSPIGGLDNQDKWAEIQKDLVNRLTRLEKSIGPYIRLLK